MKIDDEIFEEVSKILRGVKRTANEARQADARHIEDAEHEIPLKVF